MKIPFWKMHGTGNDFVMVDDRDETFPVRDTAWLQSIGRRNTGIGCEGFILIQNSDAADFRMRFLNPDGNEVEMCGNGARCVARLAHELGITGERMTFDTAAGRLHAAIGGGKVRLEMTEPTDWRLNRELAIGSGRLTYDFVNSGVPHVVLQTEDVMKAEVIALGAEVRHHRDFAPNGANVNFVQQTGRQALSVRTYERGVEAETPACGTGMVAAAVVFGRQGRVETPVEVKCANGDCLEVNFRLTDNGPECVTLCGTATHVFSGSVEY